MEALSSVYAPRLSPVDREDSLATKAYQELRQALMSGRLEIGQRLVHRNLAVELGVSPTPVREALLRLVSEGALALDERGIAYVPYVTVDTYAEILALRVELEGQAVMAAARRSTQDGIARLHTLHACLAEAKQSGDVSRVLQANERFHFQLAEMANRPVLKRLIESLWLQCGPMLRKRYEAPVHAVPEADHPHLQLLAALERGDPDAARAAIEADLQENGAITLDVLRRQQQEA